MHITTILEHHDGFPRAAGHAVGYLAAVAAIPPLAAQMPWHDSAVLCTGLLAAVGALRGYLGVVVRDALSRLRAKAVLGWVDRAAFFLLVASMVAVYAVDSVVQFDVWAAFSAIAVLAALGRSANALGQGHDTWFSSSFLSRL